MLNLKAVNQELERLGHRARLAKGDGYFYFWSGEAVDWLDRTVIVPKISSLTLQQWVDEFQKLRRKNEQIQKQAARKTPKRKPSRRPASKAISHAADVPVTSSEAGAAPWEFRL